MTRRAIESTKLRATATAAVVLAVLACPAPAWAHVGSGATGGFLNGFAHPISGLDHVLAMVAVGLWGAQLGAPAVWLLPVAFPMMMAFGGLLGLLGIPLPGVEIGIALSAVMLGVLVLGRVKLPVAAALLTVAFFALFHGYAHGTELSPGDDAVLYSIGFVVSTGLLHATGIGLGLAQRWPWGEKALRGAGALVATGGMFFLWRALG